MTRKEQLAFCSVCKHQKFDAKQGILCGLTDKLADFEVECYDFEKEKNASQYIAPDDQAIVSASALKEQVSEERYQKLLDEQDFGAALVTGLIATFLGVLLFVFIAYIAGFGAGPFKFALAAIIGLTIRYFGKGIDPKFGILGAVLTLVGGFVGTFFNVIGTGAFQIDRGYFETFELVEMSEWFKMYSRAITKMYLLWLAGATYFAYWLSKRRITDKTVIEMNREEE